MDMTKYQGGGNALNGQFFKDNGIKEMPVEIKNVVEKQFEDARKAVAIVKNLQDNEEYQFVLNVTNTNTIAEKFGIESNEWIGQQIIIKLDKTDFGGKRVDCLRVA